MSWDWSRTVSVRSRSIAKWFKKHNFFPDYPNSICFLGDIKGAKIAVDGVETVANIEIKGFTDVLPDGTVDTGVMVTTKIYFFTIVRF